MKTEAIQIRTIDWETLSEEQKRKALSRPVQSGDSDFSKKVSEIILQVKAEKDAALKLFAEKYDRVRLETFKVAPHEIQDAYQKLEPVTLAALKEAISRLTAFHKAQMPKDIDL